MEEAQRQTMAQVIQQQRSADAEPAAVPIAPDFVAPETLESTPTDSAFAVSESGTIQTPEVYTDQNFGFEQEEIPMPDNTSANEGFVKLADYLHGAISEKKSAKAIVGELKMARMMGMFSQDVLNEILATDFDELVGTLSGVHDSLRSPKARLILKDVMKGMK